MPLPSLSIMWSHYPTGEADAVKKLIGGNVNAPWITNTCVVRMSRAFNYAGAPIPRNVRGLETTSGGDGMRYAFRVAEFRPYLTDTYKAPDVIGRDRSAVAGMKGVIMFDVRGWDDATGHFDLWDGSKCAGHEYFAEAREVLLWRC